MGFFDSIVDTPTVANTSQTSADALIITDDTPVDAVSTDHLDPAPTADLLIIDETPMTLTVDSVPDTMALMDDTQKDISLVSSEMMISDELIFDTEELVVSEEVSILDMVEPATSSVSVNYMADPVSTSVRSIVSPDETLARAIAELQASDDHSTLLAEAAHTREVDLLADREAKNSAHEAELESLKATHLAAVALMDRQIADARKEVENIKAASKRTAYLKELLEAQVTV